jgi:hypothetical protein
LPYQLPAPPCLVYLAETCGLSVRVNRGVTAAIRSMPLLPSLVGEGDA